MRRADPVLSIQALVLMLGLAACGADQTLHPADIRPLHYSTGKLGLERVDGLRQALQASPDEPVRVLSLHGMITHEPRYSAELQARLAERLGLEVGPDSGQVEMARGYEFVPAYGQQPFGGVSKLPLSQLRRTAWTKREADGRLVDRLVVYEMLWSPLRDQVKETFVGCFERGDTGKSNACKPFSASLPNTDTRLPINRALKESVTLGGFADATLVLGPIGDVIRDDLTLALCVIGAEFLVPNADALFSSARQRCNLAEVARRGSNQAAAGEKLSQVKFLALTHSLGSFLFMDAQHAFVAAQGHANAAMEGKGAAPCGKDQQSCDEEQQAQLLFAMTDQATVFMNANQVSLLALARLSSAGCTTAIGARCPNPYLRARSGANEPWNQQFGMPRMTVFVALNDTDDLLGFELPPFLADTDGNRFVNVSVRNPAFKVPGLFKSPAGAHTHQAQNAAVIQAIVDGFSMP
jgi:hypothetical protein